MNATTVEVPFIMVGNRRLLTDEQIFEEPWMRDLVRRFPDSFEYDGSISVWWFIEPPDSPE